VDAIAAVIWLFSTSLLFAGAWRVAQRWFPDDTGAPVLVHVIVIAWMTVVGATLLLEALGVLTPVALTAVVTLLSATFWACRNKPPPQTRSDPGAAEVQVQTNPTGLGVSVCLLAAVLAANVIWRGLLTFPIDWDTLAYHLPLVVHWIQERSLYVPDCAFWYVPGNNEVWTYWCVGLFSGDFLVALNNVPSAVLLLAAAAQFATLIGVGRVYAFLAVVAIAATEVVTRQAIDAENDVAVAALFFSGLLYAVRFGLSRRLPDLMLFGASLGLLAGVKYYALGYAAAVALAGVAWSQIPPRNDALKVIAAAALGFCVFGGYWYFRNIIHTGTPVFPLGFTPANNIWGDMRPETLTSTLAGSGRLEVWPRLANAIWKSAGPAHAAALALLPAFVAWFAWQSLRRRKRGDIATGLGGWLALVVVLAAGVYLITPNVVETIAGSFNMLRYHSVRFGLCFLTLAVLVSSLGLERLQQLITSRAGRTPAVLIAVVWGSAVAWQAWRQVAPLVSIDLALLAADLFLALLILRHVAAWPRAVWRFRWLAAGLAIGFAAWSGSTLAHRWHDGFIAFYDARFRADTYATIAKLDAAQERICVCDYRYYPFFGSRRQYSVCRPLWLDEPNTLRRYVAEKNATLLVGVRMDHVRRSGYLHVVPWVYSGAVPADVLHENQKHILYRVRSSAIHITARKGK
jgi:hypothetical protein